MRIQQNGKIIVIGGGYGISLDLKIYPDGLTEGVEGTNYPAGTGPLYTVEGREMLGVADAPAQVLADERFYRNGDISMPRDIDTVKADLVSQIKRTANALLQPSSWMVERFADPTSGKPIPSDVQAYRSKVRAASNDNEAAIAACSSIEKLAEFTAVWPKTEEAL